MALLTEDGTGRTDADSYCTLAFADAFLAARGETLWATDTQETEREQAIRRATDYMLQGYRKRWAGKRVTTTQALDWPRNFVPMPDVLMSYEYGFNTASYYPSNAVPAEVQRACALLALKAAAGELNADLSRGVVREKMGPIEVEYDNGSPQSKRYPAIDEMLWPFLVGRFGALLAVRA
jgi:hypothetical protein